MKNANLNLKNFRLAAKLFWRECRFGEWYVIFFAILFAVAATTALHFYTDRLLRAFENQSSQFLGGDLVIDSNTPINPSWITTAKQLHLKYASVWSYPSMLSSAKGFQLVNVQAVSNTYPLLGAKAGMPSGRPAAKTVWVEFRLQKQLQLTDHDIVKIGASEFKVAKSITSDVDSLNTGWFIAPRVMMQLEDVAATKTVVPGSRVQYRLLLVGDKKQVAQFRAKLEPHLQGGQRMLGARNQQVVLQSILQKFQDYSQIILLISLMMSGVAIAFAVQQYVRRHYDHVALWRSLGAKQNQMMQIFFWQFLIVALLAGLLGIISGYFTQLAIAHLFQPVLLVNLPGISAGPIWLGFITAVFLLFAFAYPVLIVLPKTPPLYIWRGEVLPNLHYGIYLTSVTIVLLAFLYFFLDFSLLTLFFIDILLVSIGFLYAFSILLLSLLRRIREHTQGVWHRGLSEIIQHPQSTGLQFVGFSLMIMLLLILYFIRADLLTQWRSTLPQDTPNYFIINLTANDLSPLKQSLSDSHITVEQMYPVIMARIVTLNGQPILSAIPESARSHNALYRDLNLTWTLNYPQDNKIVKGKGWTQQDIGKSYVSVESNFANKLNLKLGDVLGFQVGQQTFSATVSNIRSLDWTSFRPNFLMIFTPGFLEKFPTTYMTSIHLDPTQAALIGELQQQFPNITVIDVANILMQIQTMLAKISVAIQYLFLFALAAGVLIFITSLQASMDERQQTYRLIRILGASQYYIIFSLTIELVTLAIMILLTAYIGAQIVKLLLLQWFV